MDGLEKPNPHTPTSKMTFYALQINLEEVKQVG